MSIRTCLKYLRLATPVARAAVAAIIGTIVCGPLSRLAAQPTQLISEARPYCTGCAIRLARVTNLGNDFGDRGAIARPIGFALGEKGQSYVVYNGRPFEIVVHNARGEVVRKIGQLGSGPGEFQFISTIVITRGDTLHAFDTRLHRRTIIAPDARVIRTVPLPTGTIAATVLRGDRVVMAATVLNERTIGFPLHTISATGRIERSYGVDVAFYRSDLADALMRSVAAASDSTFWSANHSEYRIEQWHMNGKRLRAMHRNPSWFSVWNVSANPHPDSLPQSAILSVSPDSAGRLWVISRLADSRWRTALERDTTTNRGRYRVRDHEMYWDTLVDVIEPATGRVLASQRFDAAFGLFFSRQHVLLAAEASDGVLTLSLNKLALSYPNP